MKKICFVILKINIFLLYGQKLTIFLKRKKSQSEMEKGKWGFDFIFNI